MILYLLMVVCLFLFLHNIGLDESSMRLIASGLIMSSALEIAQRLITEVSGGFAGLHTLIGVVLLVLHYIIIRGFLKRAGVL